MSKQPESTRRGRLEGPDRGRIALEEALEALAADLRVLGEAAGELPGDEGGSLAEEDNFQRARHELELQLVGARALLARRDLGDAADAFVALRLDAASDALAALIVRSFGYYALPNPDPLLIDNEGPIGHHRSLELMRRYAGRLEPSQEDGVGGAHYDHRRRLAEQLFGPGTAPEDSADHSF